MALEGEAQGEQLTFHQLRARSPGDATTLQRVLREEVELGRIEYRAGRDVLNGGLPADVEEALAQLRL